MIGRKSISAAALAALLVYVASPYVALYRLAEALGRGDASVLEARIDWASVRAGLKADVAAGIMGDLAPPEPQPAETTLIASASAAPMHSQTRADANVLPPFGSAFMNGIAGSMIDREVTPQHLADLARQFSGTAPSSHQGLSIGGIRSAFFDSPTGFEFAIHCPGQTASEHPLRVRLELHGGEWLVVRAWIPQDLIDLANART